jgi:hypothetical protein
MVITRTFTNTTLFPLLMFVTIYNNTKQSVPLYAKQAKRGSRGIALPTLNPSTRRRVGSWYDALLLYFPRDLVPIGQMKGWALGPVWMGLENLASTGV